MVSCYSVGFILFTLVIPSIAVPISLIGLTTNQTGVVGDQTSNRAVDGSTSSCAYPDNTELLAAEWWIDLGRMYRVDSIKLYNTADASTRMSDFVLRVYSRPGDYLTCAKYPGTVGRSSAVTLECRDDVFGDVYGRYVQFLRLGGPQIDLVEICEVEMTGAAYDGCPRGYYGADCTSSCGRCEQAPGQYRTCNGSGLCYYGCKLWWISDKCDTEIVAPSRNGKNVILRKASQGNLDIILYTVVTPAGLSQYYGYRIRYKSTVTSQIERNEPQTDSGGQLIITLRDLRPNTEYTIDVTPYRVMNGEYDYSVNGYPTLTASTLCPSPDPAIITNVEVLNNKQFEVFYQLSKNTECSTLKSIEILYKRPSEAAWRTVEASLSQSSHVVTVDDSVGIAVKLRVTNVQGEYSESRETITSELDVDVCTPCTLPWILFGVVLAVVVTETIYLGVQCKRSQQNPTPEHIPPADIWPNHTTPVDERHIPPADIRPTHMILAGNENAILRAGIGSVERPSTERSNSGYLTMIGNRNSATSGPYESMNRL